MATKTKSKPTTKKQSKSLVLKEKGGIQTTSTVPVQVDASPDNMIMIALQSGRSMEEIGKLIELRNNEIARLAQLEFNKAKSTFQGLVSPVYRNRLVNYPNKPNASGVVTHTTYVHEDLAAIELAIKTHCKELGFTYDWKTRYEGDWIYVKCVLRHTNGHSESDELRAKSDKSGGKNDIQSEASTMTYLRRYSLKAVLGLSSEDDDGRKSVKTPDKKQDHHPADEWATVLPTPDENQYRNLMSSVIGGFKTVAECEKHFSLTDDQRSALMIAENASRRTE